MAVKRFVAKESKAEPIPFEISYVVRTPKQIAAGSGQVVDQEGVDLSKEQFDEREEVELYHAAPEMPGKWLFDIGGAMAGEQSERIAAINNLLSRCIVDDDKDRWKERLNNNRYILDTDTLADIANWLIEQYNQDRPTAQSTQ